MDDESIMKVSSSIHSVDDRGGTDEGASERASRQGGHQSLAVVLVREEQGRGEERRGEIMLIESGENCLDRIRTVWVRHAEDTSRCHLKNDSRSFPSVVLG